MRFKEHKLALARGEVLPAEDVRRVMVRLVQSTKVQILAALRTGIQTAMIESALDPAKIEAVTGKVEARVQEAMRQLSEQPLAKAKCGKCGWEL